MNKTTKSESIVQITVETYEMEVFEQCISSLTNRRDVSPNDILAHALAVGLHLLMKTEVKESNARAEAMKRALTVREETVHEAIRKLKCEEPISKDELDLIWFAAREGHLGAQIIMEDFKRFGRSIAKG